MGLEGVRGMVADSKAYSRRTGLCLEQEIGFVTLVPRTCRVRQELGVGAAAIAAAPLLVEKPGRTKLEAPRRWHGQRVMRQVEVEYRGGRTAQEEVRFVVVHSSQLAQPQAPSYGAAQAKEAKAVADHVRPVHARWFACLPDAEAAIAEYAGRGGNAAGAGRALGGITRSAIASLPPRATRRARRGRPAKTDLPPTESGYRVVVAVESLSHREEDKGWTVLATTVPHEGATDAEILQAYQDQTTTVEPGFRWIKNPGHCSRVAGET